MQLEIERKRGTERDVKLITEAVPFMLKRLVKPEQLTQVHLNISITRLKGDHGDIVLEDAPYFRLRLHHESDSILLLVTLAHELVHLSQVLSGRLKFKKIKGLDVWVWDGRSYGSEPYADLDRVLPWERDAELREGDLARQFVNFYVKKLNGN